VKKGVRKSGYLRGTRFFCMLNPSFSLTPQTPSSILLPATGSTLLT
jgi:hypothetical protein